MSNKQDFVKLTVADKESQCCDEQANEKCDEFPNFEAVEDVAEDKY